MTTEKFPDNKPKPGYQIAEAVASIMEWRAGLYEKIPLGVFHILAQGNREEAEYLRYLFGISSPDESLSPSKSEDIVNE